MQELKSMTLLYVEDEVEVANLYLRYFKSKFKMVYTAQDGKRALELYDELKTDVMILDINIPFISGLEIAKKIRQDDKTTQLILLTAASDKQTFLKAVELGLTTYLEKPVSRESLKDALSKLCLKTYETLWQVDDKEYVWNIQKEELTCNEKLVKLTKNETKLLKLFASKQNAKITYSDIHEYVWFEDNSKNYSESSIKMLIAQLRKKLPKNTIENVYGVGYSLDI